MNLLPCELCGMPNIPGHTCDTIPAINSLRGSYKTVQQFLTLRAWLIEAGENSMPLPEEVSELYKAHQAGVSFTKHLAKRR